VFYKLVVSLKKLALKHELQMPLKLF